jgi:hypothetical protein
MLRRLLIACSIVAAVGLFATAAADPRSQGAGKGPGVASVGALEGRFRIMLTHLERSAEPWPLSTAPLLAVSQRARALADIPQLVNLRASLLQLHAAARTLEASAREVSGTCGALRVLGCHAAVERALLGTVFAERTLARLDAARNAYLD